MRFKILFLIVTLFLASIVGCAGTLYVETEPPPLQVEVRAAPPSAEAVWIDGHWAWRNSQYIWIAGHWENHPRGRWVPGYWERRERGYFWVEGHWESANWGYGHRRHHH